MRKVQPRLALESYLPRTYNRNHMSKSILACLYLIRANVDTSAPKSMHESRYLLSLPSAQGYPSRRAESPIPTRLIAKRDLDCTVGQAYVLESAFRHRALSNFQEVLASLPVLL